jgi:hypothetical protein
MIPKIIIVPIEYQRFTTIGDWYEDKYGNFTISISYLYDWKYEFLVLIHELTEWAICQSMGVKTQACDDFDGLWESEIKKGIQDINTEAGFDRRCPYRRGHVWGARMERLFCFLLRASWKDYCESCERAIKNYSNSKQSSSNASV